MTIPLMVDSYESHMSDYDRVRFCLVKIPGALSISFSCPFYQEIFSIAGDHLLKTKYPDFQVLPSLPGYDLTLMLPLDKLPPIPAKSKDESKEDYHKAQKGFNDKMAVYAEAIAQFRRNFFASPWEKAFAAMNAGKIAEKMEYSQHDLERIWIIPGETQITTFYGLTFKETTDQCLVKLILNELEEAKRHVQNSPAVQKYVEGSIPDILKKEFPTSKAANLSYTNGYVSITLFKQHISPTFEKAATMLQGFREYLHFHICASKTYLHGRLRKRLSKMLKDLTQAKFEIEIKKIYRSMKEENTEVVLQEEEKIGPILAKKN